MPRGVYMGYTDLHLHLEGSVSPETKKALMYMDNVVQEGRPGEDITMQLLQTEENLGYATVELAKELTAAGVDYAEIRITPQLHTTRGLSQYQVVEAVLNGYLKRLDFSRSVYDDLRSEGHSIELPKFPHIRFILCLMRGKMNSDLYDRNMETVDIARYYMNENNYLIAGLDLMGDEAKYPTGEYGDFFGIARKHHIPFTIHAGENAGPESIWEALEMGASRIGHGLAAQSDDRLMQRLADKGVVLELCPSSNIKSGVVENLDHYPLRFFLQYGIRVTINSDNMTLADTNVAKEFELLEREMCLSDGEKRLLMQTAEEAHL